MHFPDYVCCQGVMLTADWMKTKGRDVMLFKKMVQPHVSAVNNMLHHILKNMIKEGTQELCISEERKELARIERYTEMSSVVINMSID